MSDFEKREGARDPGRVIPALSFNEKNTRRKRDKHCSVQKRVKACRPQLAALVAGSTKRLAGHLVRGLDLSEMILEL